MFTDPYVMLVVTQMQHDDLEPAHPIRRSSARRSDEVPDRLRSRRTLPSRPGWFGWRRSAWR